MGASLFVVILAFALMPVSIRAQGFESLSGLIPEMPSFSEGIGRGTMREQTLEQLERQTRATGFAGAVVSPSCTASPTITDFFDADPQGRVASGPPVDLKLLEKKDPTLTELWSILRSTGMGSAILKKFEPKYGYEVRVVFSDLKDEGKRNSAALFRPAEKTIAIQRNRQAGEIAFVLLHEMVHSLDGDYRRALDKEKELRDGFMARMDQLIQVKSKKPAITPKARSPKPPAAIEDLAKQYEILRQFRDLRVYRAERFAYDASYEAWTELSRLYPSYYQGRGLAGQPVRYSDEWLTKILRIRPVYVEKFKKGECRTVQTLDI